MHTDMEQARLELRETLDTIFGATRDVYTHRSMPLQGLQVLRMHGLAESPIINVPPGVGKTTEATRFVNESFAEAGLSTIYLIPNHKSASNVPGREHWNHWEGHTEICAAAKENDYLSSKGYWIDEPHPGSCKWQEQFDTSRPTLAPIQYLFGNDQRALTYRYQERSLKPMRPEVEEFHIRIIDELMLDPFVASMCVKRSEFDRTLLDHPDESVRMMCQLLKIAFDSRSDPEKGISGQILISQFMQAIESKGVDQRQLLESLNDFSRDPVMSPWVSGSAFDLPTNFAPLLAPILLQEVEWIKSGASFNPRIHLDPKEDEFITICWRRPVKDMRPTPVLDATSSLPLFEKALSGNNYKKPRNLKLAQPENVKVFQYVDKRVTRSGVGTNQVGDKKYKLDLFERLKHDLASHVPKGARIGVVTFMGIEEQLAELIRAEGYQVPPPVHYNAARGINDLQQVDALVVFGTHIPNPIAFKREVQAFFFDEDELIFDYQKVEVRVNTRDGRSIKVSTGRYVGDPRVEDYFRQKTWAEMYQAVHRARPNNVQPGELKQIFIYTSDPIDGIEVDEILGRSSDYANALRDLLGTRESCRVADLAKVGVEPDKSEATANQFIRRNKEEIAHLANAKWDGKRFSTNANR